MIKNKLIKIGIIGDFDGRVSHTTTNSALQESADHLSLSVEYQWIPTESLLSWAGASNILSDFDALICSPGSPYKSMEGALNGVRFAREQKIPFWGICGGFQHAVIEYVRNVLGHHSDDHEESDGKSPDAILVPLSCDLTGVEAIINLKEGSKSASIYHNQLQIKEKFRCSYGVNPFWDQLFEEEAGGLKITARDDKGQACIVENRDHPFFIATLFQPQQSSTPQKTHFLINAFLLAVAF